MQNLIGNYSEMTSLVATIEFSIFLMKLASSLILTLGFKLSEVNIITLLGQCLKGHISTNV